MQGRSLLNPVISQEAIMLQLLSAEDESTKLMFNLQPVHNASDSRKRMSIDDLMVSS